MLLVHTLEVTEYDELVKKCCCICLILQMIPAGRYAVVAHEPVWGPNQLVNRYRRAFVWMLKHVKHSWYAIM